ncbi:MAG TPA: rhodanese-like domain-containing protein, partial [Spirochaetia bacterium]|nr:rhodanese-like domain-containing protein [Spirochaetia bacterium]
MTHGKCMGFALFGVLLVFPILLSGCYEGFTGADGETLKAYLEPDALQRLTKNPREDIRIIDVRPAGAYRAGHIPTAESFPSSEIMNRLGELPNEDYLIIYCETGGRAQAVIRNLLDAGYARLMNWGGIIRWPYETVKD